MPFDPEKMRRKQTEFVEKRGDELMSKYAEEIEDLEGFDEALLEEFGGTTEQLDDILAELEKAKEQNMAQAQLRQNLMDLGESTYQLARKVSDLLP
ncbi:MAG: hypothetical protein Alis3KO_27120 [Aliiglaciecola sp.]|uniref:hypothetical protein n=1 Tax=Aliiglaciecola sp. M165 TaxID=2593649 RepID=UPI00117C19F2|nr:hypothetical protein [Aliiglaciecola sp. M165]TRY30654.1 hypothetical protein FM019_12235 [Aliiglaciecola sp. M165]